MHEITFRRGLGNPLFYDESTPIKLEEVAQFSKEQFSGENISIVAEGANEEDLTKFVSESAFCYLPSSSSNGAKALPTNTFTGQEARVPSSGASSALIGIPVKPADFGKYEVLSAAIGTSTLPSTSTPLAQIPGATSHLYKYQDAGLLLFQFLVKLLKLLKVLNKPNLLLNQFLLLLYLKLSKLLNYLLHYNQLLTPH